MIIEYGKVYILILILLLCVSCNSQNKTDIQENIITTEIKEITTSSPPANITRMLIQDKKGNIWLATFGGIFKYDGKSFTNVSKDISTARFFSTLEDRKGNLWFGSIGSGVYVYDGTSFQNFTTNQGLLNNEIVCIYEDQKGNIWFGTNGGISLYNGQSFQNYIINGDTIIEDKTNKTIPNLQRPMNEVNSIVEDNSGNFWLATRGNTFFYDGKTFTIVAQNGKPFTNVRWLINDKNGNIWLGGNDGLWRYDGNTFTNITRNFVGYIYEDSNANIWTSSQSANDRKWMLSRYDEKILTDDKPIATEIKSKHEDNKGMIFGILETSDGSIWFGALDGIYHYDGNTITGFKKEVEQE